MYIFADRVISRVKFFCLSNTRDFLQNNNAFGSVYIDDLTSFNYQNNVFNYIGISYNDGTLSLRYVNHVL